MAAPNLQPKQLQDALDALAAAGGNKLRAAANMGLPRGTFEHRVREALAANGRRREPPPDAPPAPPAPPYSRDVELEALRRQLREAQAGQTMQAWAKSIVHAADEKARDAKPARWVLGDEGQPGAAGIPTLLLSDLHWGEVVRAEEIGGVNEFNLATARKRLQRVVSKTKTLLRDHVVGNYPGIVVCLGGDMCSGSIHEELEQTNEGTVMVQMLDLFEHLQAAIKELADEFGKVHIPAVTGNHGRSNKKWQAKQRAHLSYEWLMYQFLERAFVNDSRVSFQVGDGPDVDYSLLGTRYRLTHGDTFKGGDGMIGPLGPITRGAIKRGRMALAMGAPFDVLLLGHWHTLIWGANFVVNGTLKGFDEYAMTLSATPEPPAQALWLTTERHGRTIQLPVYAD
jgi:hypothetical protein